MKYLTYVVSLLLTTVVCFGQQAVSTQRYLVSSGHPSATRAGLEVLEAGGNAMDAAVTVSMSLGVAEPYGSGLGGKLVMLYYDAATKKVYCVEALCESPEGLDVERYRELERDVRVRGYQSVAVPGFLAGLHASYERWGTKPWAELIEPAAALAEAGVPMTAVARELYRPKVVHLQEDTQASAQYLDHGGLPGVGVVVKQPDLAATLREIGRDGPETFYNGPLAERIVRAARAHGSALTLKDFQSYKANFVEPLLIQYKGRTVYSCPPPLTGGVTVLMALDILEEYNWDGYSAQDPRTLHRVGGVLREVYPQVTRDIGDHPESPARALALLEDGNIQANYRRSLQASTINNPPKAPEPAATTGRATSEPWDEASTTHFVVKDEQGNWVSATLSLSNHFGACVVVPGTGMLLNNSMSNFALLSADSVNGLATGKRPRSTIAPILMLDDNGPVFALGIPGGQRIPTTSIQLMLAMYEFGLGPAEAFDLPRYHLRRPRRSGEPDNLMDLEAGVSPELTEALSQLGWTVSSRDRDGKYFGGGNAAVLQADGRTLGVADLRRTNHAGGQ